MLSLRTIDTITICLESSCFMECTTSISPVHVLYYPLLLNCHQYLERGSTAGLQKRRISLCFLRQTKLQAGAGKCTGWGSNFVCFRVWVHAWSLGMRLSYQYSFERTSQLPTDKSTCTLISGHMDTQWACGHLQHKVHQFTHVTRWCRWSTYDTEFDFSGEQAPKTTLALSECLGHIWSCTLVLSSLSTTKMILKLFLR